MLIESVETYTLRLAADVPYLGASPGEQPTSRYQVRPPYRSLYSTHYETLLVRVIAANGVEGWGEALAPVAPEIAAAAIELLLTPVLVGLDASAPRASWNVLRNLMRERGHLVGHQADALAAVDIALWDLAGKLADLPVHALLGGALRSEVPTYVSGLPRPTDEERAALAKEWAEQGATKVKLHLGNGVEADLATFDAVRSAAPSWQIAVDAHWRYCFGEALTLARGLADRGAWFFEAPLAPEDIAGHADLARRSAIPIAVGEALRNRYEFLEWLRPRALGIAQPDIGRTGITEAAAIGELSAAHHVPLAPHHSTGLGVVLAAGVHLAAIAEELLVFEYQPTTLRVAEQIMRDSVEITASGMQVPSGPGLGVSVDVEKVQRLAGGRHPG